MKRGDGLVGFLWVALGGYVVFSGFRLGFGSFASPGPGFIAVWAGSLLILFAAGLLVQGRRRRQPAPPAPFWAEPGAGRRVLLTLAGPVGFTLLLKFLGFFLCALLMLVYLFRAIHPHRWRLALLLAGSSALVCFVVFQYFLQIQFPPGLLDLHRLKGWLP
ncbi:MAG: tripartite tricarboxylate transporter TctB family protein [Desulfobacterales bacterium]